MRRGVEDRRPDRRVLALRFQIRVCRQRLRQIRYLAGRLLCDVQHVRNRQLRRCGLLRVRSREHALGLSREAAVLSGAVYGGRGVSGAAAIRRLRRAADQHGRQNQAARRLTRLLLAVRLQRVRRPVQPARHVEDARRLGDPGELDAHRSDRAAGREFHTHVRAGCHAELRPGAGHYDARRPRRSRDVSIQLSKLRNARVAPRESFGDRRRGEWRALVRAPLAERNARRVPARHVRARRHELALDGKHRPRSGARLRARIQHFEQDRRSVDRVDGSSCVGRARRDGAGRSDGRCRHGGRIGRLPPQETWTVGRLQQHDGRPDRRLHLLVHDRALSHDRRLDVGHADRVDEVSELRGE